MGTFHIGGALKVGSVTADLSGPENGLLYYRSDLNKFRFYQNSSFLDLATTADLLGSVVVYGRSDGSKKNILATSDFIESAINDLDDAIGALDLTPTNYTPANAAIVASHLAAIDSALSTAGQDDYLDTDFRISDNGDNTKKIAFQASGIGTGNTRTITMPNSNVDLGKVDTAIQAGGTVAFSANQSMGSNKLTNLGAPTSDNDAARKIDVDAAAAGVAPKNPVSTATNAQGMTGAPFSGTFSVGGGTNSRDAFTSINLTNNIGGVAPTLGMRVLVKDEATQTRNGIYVVTVTGATGQLERSADFDDAPSVEVKGGNTVFVDLGDFANTIFRLSGTGDLVVNTDNLVWVIFSRAESLTFSSGVQKSGSAVSANVDNSTIEVNTNQLRIKDLGVTNAKVATGIDASKLADGSVSNAEFQFISTLSSNAQTQLNAKLANVVEDTTPQLGGSLDLNGQVILQGSAGIGATKIGSSASDFIEEQYYHSVALASGQTNTIITEFNFAHASFESLVFEYKLKESTSNDIRVGRFSVVTNGTAIDYTDTYNQTADTGISFSAVVNGANINVRYSSGGNGATLRAYAKRFKA